MFKKFLFFLVIGLVLSIPMSIFADGGLIIFPPQISLDEAEQNAIVAWNGEEEVFILSIDLKAGAEASVLKIIPLPTNPSQVKQAEFELFDRLVEIINQKIEDYWDRFPMWREDEGLGSGTKTEGVEITFHEKIGSHNVIVAKVNDLDEFIIWVKDYLNDNELLYDNLSLDFKNIVADYLKRNIKFFVFDLVEADQTVKSIEPIIYRFLTDYLFYPLEITAFSDAGETVDSEVNLFLITKGQPNSDTVDGAQFTVKAGYIFAPIKLNQQELTEVSPEIASLFVSEARVSCLYYRGQLNKLDRDLVMANLIKTDDSPKVYQVIGDKRFWVLSAVMFNDRRFNWTDIKVLGADQIGDYAELNLIKDSNDDRVYYVSVMGLKRHIPSIEVFESYGYRWQDIVEVSSGELKAYADNILIQKQDDNKVYKLDNNLKCWIKSIQTFTRLGYQWSKISLVNQVEFDSYAQGPVIE